MLADHRAGWSLAFAATLVFIFVAAPFMYRFTNAVFGGIGIKTLDEHGNVTYSGLFLHALVFLVLTGLFFWGISAAWVAKDRMIANKNAANALNGDNEENLNGVANANNNNNNNTTNNTAQLNGLNALNGNVDRRRGAW
jgi:hypothetical protein